MAKVLFIIAPRNFRDEELAVPRSILQEAGHEAEIASTTTATVRGMLGLEVNPDLTVEEALGELEGYSAVIVVGGSGAPELAKHLEVLKLLKKAVDQGKIIGAICLGPQILAQAGILEGRRATVWCSALDNRPVKILEAKGATYVAQDVVQDGDITTANGPAAAEQFANAILNKLRGES